MRPRSALRGTVLVLLGLAAGACATVAPPEERPTAPVARVPVAPPAPPAPPPPSAREKLAAPHNEAAEKFEQEGLLYRALEERTIALTINPDDAKAQEARTRLRAMIERGVAERVQEGRAAAARGSYTEARRRFLSALALDPMNPAVLEVLRNEVKEVESINHTVRQGDTLASLAQQYYGERPRFEVIAETNQLPLNARLTPGQVIKIPEIPGVPFIRPAPPRAATAGAAPAAPAPGAATPAGPSEPAREEPQPEANPLLAEAQEAFERKGYAVALADLEKLLAGNPAHPEAVALKKRVLYQQGRSEFEARNYDASLKTLTQLARLAPDYENTGSLIQESRKRLINQYYSQGIKLYREEKLREAIAQWRLVLELDPGHANAKRNLEQSERLLKGLEDRKKK